MKALRLLPDDRRAGVWVLGNFLWGMQAWGECLPET